jgi:stage V sporulation protein R
VPTAAGWTSTTSGSPTPASAKTTTGPRPGGANHCDFTFINTFLDQDFVNRHRLFVAGRRLNSQKMVWEFYVKSRRLADYRQMILDSLYHPPHITVGPETAPDKDLFLIHHFEGKPLVAEYIPAVLLGMEYLWGHAVHLDTSEPIFVAEAAAQTSRESPAPSGITWRRVRYTMKARRLSKSNL